MIAATILNFIGIKTNKWEEKSNQNIYEIKKRINKELEEIDKKILVVIDDIDRLNEHEIRNMFQLVKSIGDFSNTVFLLAFEKKIVARALENVQEGSGYDYLEKIIQIPFEIPFISEYEIEVILNKRIDIVMKENKLEFEQSDWNNIFNTGFKYVINNIRDINRFVNSIYFNLPLVKDDIYFIDLLAILGIEIYIPELYNFIRENKSIFSFSNDFEYYTNRNVKEKMKEILEKNLSDIIQISNDNLIAMLKTIFPKLKYIYDDIAVDNSIIDRYRREGRICVESNFEIYFKLSVPVNTVSKSEALEFFAEDKMEILGGKVVRQINSNRITIYIDKAFEYFIQLPQERFVNIVKLLLEYSDKMLFRDNRDEISIYEYIKYIGELIYAYIKKISEEHAKYIFVIKLLEDTKNSKFLPYAILSNLLANELFQDMLTIDDNKKIESFQNKKLEKIIEEMKIDKIDKAEVEDIIKFEE